MSSNLYCNPHTSKTTEDLVDQVRYKILESLNTNADEYSVVFASGATGALKLLGETFEFVCDSGCFSYLRDNHTSVLGLREIVGTRNIKCVERDVFLNESFRKIPSNGCDDSVKCNNLFVFPAQCNFNGFKYPLELINSVRSMDTNASEWYVCLDVASFAATNYLDLKKYPADFICLSFYKQFGYPTGLGALLISKRGENVIRKKYYGGGTVKIALSDASGWHQKRDCIHERYDLIPSLLFL